MADSSLSTMADRVRDFGITMAAERTATNPYMQDTDWQARHWRCILKCGRKRMTVYFSRGMAHTDPPTADEIVNALAMDAASMENTRNFEEWCAEYGYDTDSRKAERTYRNVEKLTARLKSLIDPLGAAAWQNLLYHTESL
jgi:hypothetical protein